MAIDPWCGRGLLGSLAAALGRLACVPGVSRACPGRIGIFSLFFKSKNGILLGYPYLSHIWRIGVSTTSCTAIQRILTYRCFVAPHPASSSLPCRWWLPNLERRLHWHGQLAAMRVVDLASWPCRRWDPVVLGGRRRLLRRLVRVI